MKKVLFVCLLTVMTGLAAVAGPDRDNKHTVKKGETLYSISRAYGVKVKDLVKVNPSLTTKSNLKLGQKLNIPGKASAGVVSTHLDSAYQTSTRRPKATVTVAGTPDTPYKEEDNKTRSGMSAAPDNAILEYVAIIYSLSKYLLRNYALVRVIYYRVKQSLNALSTCGTLCSCSALNALNALCAR